MMKASGGVGYKDLQVKAIPMAGEGKRSLGIQDNQKGGAHGHKEQGDGEGHDH